MAMETTEELVAELEQLLNPEARGNALTLGLARGIIWDEGELPADSPNFPEFLTNDLLNHGFTILSKALRLLYLEPGSEILDRCFRTAAEAIESAVRRGEADENRGFNLFVSAAAFHLGHYGARSYSLLQEESLNLSSVEKLLVLLMQRRLGALENQLRDWLVTDEHTDAGLLAQLEKGSKVSVDQIADTAVRRLFHQAIADFDMALRSGHFEFVERAVEKLEKCVNGSEKLRHVPLWWASILARHLVEDLWDRSLHNRIPPTSPAGDRWPLLRRKFIQLVTARQIAEVDLWPSQLEAASRVIDETDSLVVALPTSSGKTRVAELCILQCLAGSRRVVYVTPFRALSAQVEGTLGRTFRPLGFSVTSVYGASGVGADDVTTLRSADIVVATPEKLDFAARQDASVLDDVGLIVLDEGHMIGFGEREIRYEVLVQRLLRRGDATNRRLVCLSAIFKEGDAFNDFTRWIQDSEDPTPISSDWRPTRQRPAIIKWLESFGRLEFMLNSKAFVHRFVSSERPTGRRRKSFPNDITEFMVAAVKRFHQDGHSTLVYCPLRKSVEPSAKAFIKAFSQGYFPSLLNPDDLKELDRAKRIGREWLGEGHVAVLSLDLGIAVHHGQLPRPFLSEVENLLRKKVLPVAVASPTLAQGVDLSFSVLLMRSLKRGRNTISPKEFANVVGRVGRAFVDIDGIYALLVYEDNLGKANRKIREFKCLVDDAKQRELESGLYLLIHVCILMLKEYLEITDENFATYVMNQQEAIDAFCDSETDEASALRENLSDLDAGILTLIEDHECSTESLSELLDSALRNSYWESRLAVRGGDVQLMQKMFMSSRANRIWQVTTASQRKGYFAAGLGVTAGNFIGSKADELRSMLTDAARSIYAGDPVALSKHCGDLASVLFTIYPFDPDSIDKSWSENDWRKLLKIWVAGEPLWQIQDQKGISFIQEAVVFRLVWGVEAVRVVLNQVDPYSEEQMGMDTIIEWVAVCLTYGVPSVSAARLLESGIESRVLAKRLVDELKLSFDERADVLIWFNNLDSPPAIELSVEETEIWNAFCDRLTRERSDKLKHHSMQFELPSEFDESLSGPALRITSSENGVCDLLTSDFQNLGTLKLGIAEEQTVVGKIDGRTLSVSYFTREN